MKKIRIIAAIILVLAFVAACPVSADYTELNIPEDSSNYEFELSDIPAYGGDPYVTVNDGEPYFSEEEIAQGCEPYEVYSDLDMYGRCGIAMAHVCLDTMPTDERGEISGIYPSGWIQGEYDFVDGRYLYNRSHLIGWQLAGENANEENLITGTRYMNVEGMLPFENMVADYVKETENHVLYRVTPIFEDENLVASGVLMEAYSVEDSGDGILFCVYCYNVQPGVVIDYSTGINYAENEGTTADETTTVADDSAADQVTYILNTNTYKFHYPSCSSVSQMSDKNKQEFTGTREEVIAMGYEPCGRCNP